MLLVVPVAAVEQRDEKKKLDILKMKTTLALRNLTPLINKKYSKEVYDTLFL